MSANTSLLAKARQGRRAALAALTVARLCDDDENVVSIFDEAFDAHFPQEDYAASNVVAFPVSGITPRPALLAA